MHKSGFCQLKECHGTCGGNVERIHTVGHRNFNSIITICNGLCGKTVPFRAEDDSELSTSARRGSRMESVSSQSAIAAV